MSISTLGIVNSDKLMEIAAFAQQYASNKYEKSWNNFIDTTHSKLIELFKNDNEFDKAQFKREAELYLFNNRRPLSSSELSDLNSRIVEYVDKLTDCFNYPKLVYNKGYLNLIMNSKRSGFGFHEPSLEIKNLMFYDKDNNFDKLGSKFISSSIILTYSTPEQFKNVIFFSSNGYTDHKMEFKGNIINENSIEFSSGGASKAIIKEISEHIYSQTKLDVYFAANDCDGKFEKIGIYEPKKSQQIKKNNSDMDIV